MTVLHHITAAKCDSGCLKIIMDAELVTDMKPQFPSLHADLTWILLIFLWGIFEKQGLFHYSLS
jgi:hypothetical protein